MNKMLDSPVVEAAKIAALNADIVDIEKQFPIEAIQALKRNKLMSNLIPLPYGGAGHSLTDVASICFTLGQSCGSTGLIYAMHQIQVAMLLASPSEWHKEFFRRIVNDQLLLASVTSEENIGGSIRTSACAIEFDLNDQSRFVLCKKAPTISYGEHANALLVTAKRNPSAPASDQVLVTLLKEQYDLKQTTTWDTLGMRGTCSHGYVLSSSGSFEQISPMSFGEMSEMVMLPVSHLLWSSVWLGIATDALTKARAFLRSQAGKITNGSIPPGATRLADALGKLQAVHSRIKYLLQSYETTLELCKQNSTNIPISLTTEMNNLKVTVSDAALHIVDQALMICGMAGFKNNTPYSLGRHLRDIHSARLMISNDRISMNSANFLYAQRSPIMVF